MSASRRRFGGGVLVLVGAWLLSQAASRQALRAPSAPPSVCPYSFPPRRAGSVEPEIRFHLERLRRDPSSGLDQACLAAAYLRQARVSMEPAWFLLAEKAAQQSLSLQPLGNTPARLVMARVAEARHDFAAALALSNEPVAARDRAEWLAIRVTALLALGEVRRAADSSQQLLLLQQGAAEHALRAQVLLAVGDESGACASFRSAIAREQAGEPQVSAWTRTLLARWWMRRGRLSLAESALAEALRILPDYPFALVLRGELGVLRGRLPEAQADFELVWQRTSLPASLVAAAQVAGMQASAEAGRGEADVRGAERRQAAARRAGELLRQASQVLIPQEGQPGFGHRRDLARLLLCAGGREAAPRALALMRAEAAQRRDAETLDALAAALLACGQAAEARSLLRELLARGGREAEPLLHLAEAEERLGHPLEASRWRQEALRVNPLCLQALAQAGRRMATIP